MSFLQDYQFYTTNSEACENYHLWSCITALSAIVSRRVFVDQGHFRVYPNLYTILVGPPGNRKTSAMSIAKQLIRELKTIPFGADCITKEALVLEIAGNERSYIDPKNPSQPPVVYSPNTVFVTEFSQFVGAGGLHMVDFLTTVYDQDFYEYKTKNKGNQLIVGPFLTMLGCTTPSWISARMKDDVISGGFSRRALFIYEYEEDKRIAFPEITPEQHQAWERMILRAKALQEVCGQFEWEPEAKEWYKSWYEKLITPTEETTVGYYRSKHIQLLKLTMLVTLAESSSMDLTITKPYLLLSLALLERIEKNLTKVFEGVGRNELSGISTKILNLIEMNKGPVPEKVILSALYREANSDELAKIIYHLQKTERLERLTDTVTGKVVLRLIGP